MIAIQQRLTARLDRRGRRREQGGWLLRGSVALTGVYGGYFGAAQGVILIGLLAIGLGDDLQRCNALKNVLAATVNAVAAVMFVIIAPVAWVPAAILAGSSIIGGQIGARASHQSEVVDSRAQLDRQVEAVRSEFAGREITRPPWWGGERIRPHSYEFWQNREDRLHDRLRYTPDAGGWRITRLQP